MSSAHSPLYSSYQQGDSLTREIYLLDNVSIQGRKTELRQLLKLLNLAKTGQPKAALITGDAGIGKSALLKTFTQLVRDGLYCRILDLGTMTYQTPEALYVGMVDALIEESEQILDEALIAVNEITQELELRWERTDLIRAIALVKLQESIGGKDAVSQEQLVKAIRSQVPAIKKLKLSVNDKVEKLVDLLVNPWVMVATSILSPINPSLQEALKLAERLKNRESDDEEIPIPPPPMAENKPSASAVYQAQTVKPIQRGDDRTVNNVAPRLEQLPPLPVAEMSSNQTVPQTGSLDVGFLGEGIVSAPRPVKKKPEPKPENNALDKNNEETPVEIVNPSEAPGQGTALTVSNSPLIQAMPPTPSSSWGASSGKQGGHPLIPHLMAVLDFVNQTIGGLDSGLLITLDEWDRIVALPKRETLKEFFAELLNQVTERKNYHLMLAMTARTEGESYTLGGSIYNNFRTKMLLDPLSETVCRKWSKSTLKADMGDDILALLFEISRGNPYWHFKLLNTIQERLESNRVTQVDRGFFDKLGIDGMESLPELSFTRLKLMFLNDEESLFKVIAALLKRFDEQPFSAAEAIRELSTSQGFTDGYVFEVLRALFRHDFIRLEHPPKKAKHDLSPPRRNGQDPHYGIPSRLDLSFLRDKTRTIETEISTSEKLVYLKRIIPLSIQSGDLDREKTKEILALGDAMGHPEIVTFLESLFLEALHDEKAVVRVTALNNIALIDSQKAREALFEAMRDETAMVREYAAENLAALSQRELSRINASPALAEQVISVMIDCLDDESDVVRTQIYNVLVQCRNFRDLTSVFLKGITDACEGVRMLSIRNLVEMETDSPLAFVGLLDSVNDPNPEVRRYACMGLQKYPVSEAIEAIVKILKQDSSSSLRALAADSLSRMDDARAFPALVSALRTEMAEDVKLAVVRALGKRPDAHTENVLLETLAQADSEAMPVFVWAAVRSLGQIGGTTRALECLGELRKRADNPIILGAVDLARHKISERLNEIKERERRAEEGDNEDQSVMVMISGANEDVILLEEDLLPS